MRYPLSKFVLMIAIAAWAFNARPFSFVLWSLLVSIALFVFMYAWEKRKADTQGVALGEPFRQAIRKDMAGTGPTSGGANKPSDIERLRDQSRSIL